MAPTTPRLRILSGWSHDLPASLILGFHYSQAIEALDHSFISFKHGLFEFTLLFTSIINVEMDDELLMNVCVVGGNAVSAFLSWRLQATNACDVTLVWKSGFESVYQYGISFK
jgi:hypothetical protein